jgi:hypothetical protein
MHSSERKKVSNAPFDNYSVCGVNACMISVDVCALCAVFLLLCDARPGHTGFGEAERWFWRDAEYGQAVLGYVKSHKKLTHVVIRNAGHMVGQQAVRKFLLGSRVHLHECRLNCGMVCCYGRQCCCGAALPVLQHHLSAVRGL